MDAPFLSLDMLKMQNQFKKKSMTKPTNILKGLIKKRISGFRGSQKIAMLLCDIRKGSRSVLERPFNN